MFVSAITKCVHVGQHACYGYNYLSSMGALGNDPSTPSSGTKVPDLDLFRESLMDLGDMNLSDSLIQLADGCKEKTNRQDKASLIWACEAKDAPSDTRSHCRFARHCTKRSQSLGRPPRTTPPSPRTPRTAHTAACPTTTAQRGRSAARQNAAAPPVTILGKLDSL